MSADDEIWDLRMELMRHQLAGDECGVMFCRTCNRIEDEIERLETEQRSREAREGSA